MFLIFNKIQYGEEFLNLTLNIMVLSNEQKYYMFSFKKIKESQKPISIMFIDMNLSGRGMTLNNIINENNKNVNPIKETKIGDVFWLGDSMKIEVVGIKKHRKDNFMFNEDRFFKKELTSLPKKSASFNVGDEVEVDGVKGEITEIKPMRFSDTCTYKIKLDNGKEVYRYEEEIDNTNESRRQIKMDKRYRNENKVKDIIINEIIQDLRGGQIEKTSDILEYCDDFVSELQYHRLLDVYKDVFEDYISRDEMEEVVRNSIHEEILKKYSITESKRRNEEHRREFVHVKRITGDDYRPGKPKEGFVVGYIEDGIGLRKYFTNEDDARDFVENELKAEFKLDEFYESKKRRNELSDDVKRKVFAQRKAQADRAIKALNRSSKLMANQGVGIPDEVEVTFKSGNCETEEDSYEEGVIGGGTYWYNNKPKTFKLNIKSSDFVKELAEKMGEYLYCYWVDKDDIRVRIDGDELALQFSIMGDENNDEPSERQFDSWRKGTERLWLIDGFINVEISETDKPYFIKALKDAGVEVEEF